MRHPTEISTRRARAIVDDEREPVPAVIWVVGGVTLLWAVSFLVRLVA